MSTGGRVAAVALVILIGCATASRAQPAEPPLVDQVRRAIDRGVQYLRDQEKGNGNWEVNELSSTFPGGWTSLAMLALLNSGVKPDDPIIDRGLKYLRGIPPSKTYVVGLQTMVFAAAGRDEDRERIQRNVDWLVETRVTSGGRFNGWSYPNQRGLPLPVSDNSNTQYAMLGLHEGHVAGARIEAEVWRKIREYYQGTQRLDGQGQGGWGYTSMEAEQGPRFTMTTAGLCGLLIAGAELNQGREKIQENGTATGCGIYEEDRTLAAAVGWIGKHFQIVDRHGTFYNIYGIERAGRLTGMRFLGGHDWYREGCQFLVRTQSPDGYWQGEGGQDTWPVISTSFALLFLSKGRTPIMISKIMHNSPGDDWNNDRHDAQNLVAYASREMFKRQPLAWQIFDAKRGIENSTREETLSVAGELMQSPIAYFNGHEAPMFTAAEKDVLKEYVNQGGFILAEACCGRPEFDRGFRDLMHEMFPDTPLRPLEPDHPVWRSFALVRSGEFRLLGIDKGCKTVVIYSPQDLSCLWESNQASTGRGQQAFRLGANIIAYASGMELPKPRLSAPEIIRDTADAQKVPRGYLKVVQLRHEGDWQPAPRAMHNLMAYLQDRPKLPVSIQTEAVYPRQESVLDYKFLYLHGRNAFSYATDARALDNLRANLQTGGLLFGDACCGKKAFDISFRQFMSQLFPENKLEPIPLSDELFSKELNGEAVTRVRCRRERTEGVVGEGGFQEVPPALEGVRLRGRWVVIYSKYDIGCALERHQSSDCLGHDYPSALRIGGAAVLYALSR